MCHPCRTTYGTGYNLAVGVLLTLDLQVGVECCSTEPEIGIVTVRRVTMHLDAGDILEQFTIKFLHMLVVGDVVVNDSHLPPADSGTDVAHTIVVADVLVLIIRVAFTSLGGIEKYLVLGGFILADECATA